MNISLKHYRVKLILPMLALLFLIGAVIAMPPATAAHSPYLPQPQTSETAPLTATLGIETVVNLGVQAGNGAIPRHLAYDPDNQQIFVFSEGDLAKNEGNSLSLYDIETGEIVDHLSINNGDNAPLDLKFDPASGLLYALWQERYSGVRPILTVVDAKQWQTAQEIPDVEAFAVSDGQLYLANAEQLRSVNLSNNDLAQAQQVDFTTAAFVTGPMAISRATDRLYLARSGESGWNIEIYEAGSLAFLSSYPAESQVLNIFPLPADDQILFTTDQGGFRVLNRITGNGELADLPYDLGPYSGAAGITISPDGQTLFYSNGQFRPSSPTDDLNTFEGPAIIGLDSATLLESHYIPLLTNVDDLVVDGQNNLLFGVYPFDHYLYEISLDSSDVQIVNTLIRLRDVLVDSAGERLFVSDSANRIRQLDREELTVLAQTQLQNNASDFGFKLTDYSGELALDPQRNRLYVSGLPAAVLRADTLAEINSLEPGGQLEPDPDGDVIYVSNCGVTLLDAETLREQAVISGTTRRPNGLAPNPCVSNSRLDSQNKWLYSIVPNGVPGSNGGNYLSVFDIAAEPTLIYSDTNISTTNVWPDPEGKRAYVSYVRNSNRRLRTVDPTAGTYTNQLMGVWGTIRYSLASNRLYVNDREQQRILALDGSTLNVVDELRLPPDDDWQLAELDPATDRLYLAGSSGRLLVAAPIPASVAALVEPIPSSPPRPANGPILNLAGTNQETFARIETRAEDFSRQTRLYETTTGQSWDDLSQSLPPYPLQAIAVSPAFTQDQTILASVLSPGQTGGLYRSVDSGQSWQPAMTGLRDVWVESLAMAPNFGETGLVLANTIYGGLHVSVDGGQSWSPLALLDPNLIFPISSSGFSAAFGGDNVILASQALAEMRGIYRASLAVGEQLSTWRPLFDQPVSALGLSPDGQTALAFETTLWRSVDGGQSWQAGGSGLTGIDNLQADRFYFSPDYSSDQTVYLFFRGVTSSDPGRLFRSTDGGQSWQAWRQPNTAATYTAFSLAANGDFLLGDADTQLTTVKPASVQWAANSLPTGLFPIDSLAVSPDFSSDQTIFALSGTHGLFKTANGGQRWLRTNFPVRTSGFSLARPQVALSPTYGQNETVFVATGLSLHRSTSGGRSWEQLSSPDSGSSFPVQRVALSPDFAQDQTLLVSTPLNTYRSTDGGDSWQPVLSLEGEPGRADVLVFGPDGQTAYARFGYGSPLFISSNGGQNWQQHSSGQDEFFSILAAETALGGDLIAAVEYERKLLQAEPQQQAWRDDSAELPAELNSLTAAAYAPDGALYLAGDGGIFRRSSGQSWQMVDSFGLPANVTISQLETVDGGLFVAASDGAIYSTIGAATANWNNISILK